MFKDLYKKDNELIVPSAQLVKAIGARMQAEIDNPAPLKTAFPFGKIAAVAACLCIVIAAGVILPRLLANNDKLVSKAAETTAAETAVQNEPTVTDGDLFETDTENNDEAEPVENEKEENGRQEEVEEALYDEPTEENNNLTFGFTDTSEESSETVAGGAAETTSAITHAETTEAVTEQPASPEEAETLKESVDSDDEIVESSNGDYPEEEEIVEDESVDDCEIITTVVLDPLPEAATLGELFSTLGIDLSPENLYQAGYVVPFYSFDGENESVAYEEAIVDFQNGGQDPTPIVKLLENALSAPRTDNSEADEFLHLYFDRIRIDIANTDMAVVSDFYHSGAAYYMLPEGSSAEILKQLKGLFADSQNTEDVFIPSGGYSELCALLTDIGIGGTEGIDSCFTSYSLKSEGISGPGAPVSEYGAIYELLSKYSASSIETNPFSEMTDRVYFNLTTKNSALTVNFWRNQPELIEVTVSGKAYQFVAPSGAFDEALKTSKAMMGIISEPTRSFETLGEMLDSLKLSEARMDDIFSPRNTDSEDNYEYWLYIARGNEKKIIDIIAADRDAKPLETVEESDREMIYIGIYDKEYYITVVENDVIKIGFFSAPADDRDFPLPKGTYNKLLTFIKENGDYVSGNYNTDVMIDE